MNRVVIPAGTFERISAGDEEAFEELYRITYRPLFAFLLSMTGNYEDASDLLQETYIRIHSVSHKYEDRGSPMAWIMKISRNLFLMKKRSDKRNAAEDAVEIREDDLSLDCISDAENRILIEELFTAISEEDRNIVIMHSVMGFRFREIAAETGMPLGTVITRHRRALKKLEKKADLKWRD